jgi:hypothetical protein
MLIAALFDPSIKPMTVTVVASVKAASDKENK